ncbi:MAG TPA: Hsp20/alpha crystallin family protein [Anaerolineales bacterium]|nr:Hsp20/alpha crystallin family protein [Anaerolineales bacterium]
MIDVLLKSDPLRPGWYLSEEVQPLSPGTNRWRLNARSHVWRPPTDVYETEDAIIVRVEIAGMQEEDFSISLAGRLLSIRGIRPDQPERRAYHQMEIFFGEFLSEIELPCAVLAEGISAEYRSGFLRLVLLKDRPKKIQVVETL